MNEKPTSNRFAQRVMATLSANRTVFSIAVIGTLLESVVVLSSANDFRPIMVSAVIALISWVWLTIGWALHLSVRATKHVGRNLPRPSKIMLYGASMTVGMVMLLAYLSSWAFYLRSGRFATVESIRFFWENITNPVLWWYFVGSESSALVGVVLLLSLFAIFLITHSGRLSDRVGSGGNTSRLASIRRTAWWAQILVIAGMVISLVMLDGSDSRRFQGIDWLGRRSNPLISLLVSGAEATFDTPIEPCLNEESLVPIDTEWKLPSLANRARPSVILIAVESLRADAVHQVHQGRAVMPHLSALAERSLQFRKAYTQSTHSDYADVAVLSSLYPLRTRHHHYYRSDDPWPKTLIYDLLHQDGYRTAIISAQNESWGGMSHFLETPGLDLFYDAERSGIATKRPGIDYGFAGELEAGTLTAGKLDDRDVTRRALRWIDDHRATPFFLSINFQSSHFPYLLSEPVDRPFTPCEIDFDASFMHYPPEKTDVVRNAYFNALHLIDAQIGQLVSRIDSLRSEQQVILVAYGENGEAFHENGHVTHAKPPFEPMVRVPWIVFAPEIVEPGWSDYPTELIDVVPTILGRLRLPRHPNFQGIDVLASDRPEIQDRNLFLHTELQGVSRVDAIVNAGRWKLHHDRERDSYLLFDLSQDPDESVNLATSHQDTTKKLIEKLRRWRAEQLAYYHYPHYYERFYPP